MFEMFTPKLTINSYCTHFQYGYLRVDFLGKIAKITKKEEPKYHNDNNNIIHYEAFDRDGKHVFHVIINNYEYNYGGKNHTCSIFGQNASSAHFEINGEYSSSDFMKIQDLFEKSVKEYCFEDKDQYCY